MRVFAVIVAGGEGRRFGSPLPKQFARIFGKTLLEMSVIPFERSDRVDEIIVVVNSSYLELGRRVLMSFKKVMRIVGGGKTRQESVRKGLESINEDEGKVLIHDAVRPFISTIKIEEVIDLLNDYNAVSLALPVKETIGIAGEGGVLIDIPDRKKLFSLQTPQGFKLSLIRCAHAKALEENFREATDDCSLVKRYFPENPIFLAPGEEKNIKITYSMDLKVAEAMLSFSEKGLEK